MYNAVAAITGEYELYKWDGVAPKVASPEAAAAAAAHRILDQLLPRRQHHEPRRAARCDSLANVRNPVARAEWRGVRRPRRQPHHRPADERRPRCDGDRSDEGHGLPGAVATDSAGFRRVHDCVAGWRHPDRPDLGHPVRPRSASGPHRRPVSRRPRRGPGHRGGEQPSHHLPVGDRKVLLRRGHPTDATGAAGVRPETRAGHRRQRPVVRRGGYGHRGWSHHRLECEAPGTVLAASHGYPRVDGL